MAKTTIIISDKVRPDGKSRIYAYVSVTRTNRFRIKTPIFITRSFFNDKLGEVIIPRKDKADIDTIREAMRQSSELNAFISRLSGIMSAGNPSGEITKEWFEHVLALQDNENISLKKHDINRFDLERAFNEETRIIEEEQRQTERIKVADALLAYISNNDFSEYRNKAISTVARVVNRFEMFKQLTADKNFELYADSMTPEDAEELREYMSHESQLSKDYPRSP